MKELTIEEKAKRYNKVIEELRAMMPNWENLSYNGKTFLQDLVHIIPELKESDGERMVKFIKKQLFNIKETITENYELDAKLTKAIDWLEKQGEQKPVKEHKFKVGDYIKPIDGCLGAPRVIKEVHDGWYCTNKGSLDFEFEDNWTIVECESTAWNEEDDKNLREISCLVGNYRSGDDEYKLDSWLKSLKGGVQPKQEWSEKDREMKMKVLKYLSTRCNAFEYAEVECWLKSLRPQSHWKPSKEQVEALQAAIGIVGELTPTASLLKEIREQLKKLREE